MTSQDRNALVALIILLILIQKDSKGGFKFGLDSGLGPEAVPHAVEQVTVGVVTYAIVRLLLSRLAPAVAAAAGAPVALAVAAGFALLAWPKIRDKVRAQGGTSALPCGLTLQQVGCGGSGIKRWGTSTEGGKRWLTAICNDGTISTTELLEGCKNLV